MLTQLNAGLSRPIMIRFVASHVFDIRCVVLVSHMNLRRCNISFELVQIGEFQI